MHPRKTTIDDSQQLRAFQTLWRSDDIALALVSVEPTLECRYLDVNAGFASLLGYASAELVGNHSTSILAQGDQLIWLGEIRRLVEGRLEHLYQVQRFIQRGGKQYVTCQCWCWLLPDRDGHGAAVLCHIRRLPDHESDELRQEHQRVIRDIEALQAEFIVMKRRVEELTAGQHPELIDINIGDTVGGDATKNDVSVLKWLVIGLIALAMAGVWYEYYRHGGQEAPPKPPVITE
ncbi:MAG: PAS domain S-box protein [Pirellulales bacterium]